QTKIILGSYGTSIENIEALIPCDYVCRGDGVAFLRNLFNEPTDAPINHPIRYSSCNRYILGLPVPNRIVPEGIVMPGVGCVNGCRFCCTSHFFQKHYTPFIETGRQFFDLCRAYEDKMGITDFFVLDENFFKSQQRSLDLLALMEKHNKTYSFNIFTSAETIQSVGIDVLQRIGIDFVWIGVEGIHNPYDKNVGVDFKSLIRDLRKQGISVLISGILFSEKHDKKTIHEEIDYIVNLKADFVQFMELYPSPGTPLYKDYSEKGVLVEGMPFEDWHAQDKINFRHPHFTGEETSVYLKNAFIKDFQENGPSILRMAETMLMGAQTTAGSTNEYMKLRHRQRLANALAYYPAINTLVTHAPDAKARAYAEDVKSRYRRFFKKRSLKVRLYSAAIQAAMIKEKLRGKFIYNNLRQPPTLYTKYRRP
ncbi:MAG: radical SAM protein, partial [bacterium]|nr:radical SAM protein [bacterium]